MLILTLFSLLFSLVLSDCPDGFVKHGQSCYVLIRTKSSWGEANAYCQTLLSKLVQIESDTEENFLTNWLQTESSTMSDVSGVWIGGHDLTMEGEYQWAGSFEKIEQFWWDQGEPNNNGNQDCILMWKNDNFLWCDIECNDHEYFVCERDGETVTDPIG